MLTGSRFYISSAMALLVLACISIGESAIQGNETAMKTLFNDIFEKLGIVPDNPFPSGRLQLRNGNTSKCYHFRLRPKEDNVTVVRDCDGQDVRQMVWLRPVRGFVALSPEDGVCTGSGRNTSGSVHYLVNNYDPKCQTKRKNHFVVQRKKGHVRFRLRTSGHCVSVSKARKNGGHPLVAKACKPEVLNQRWYLCHQHGAFKPQKCWP